MKHIIRELVRLFLLVFLFSAPTGCGKDPKSIVPWVPVSIQVSLATHIDLTVPGGYIYFPNEGYAGVILYCADNINQVYYAFDASCTHEISKECSLVKEGAIEGSIASCPCCGSKYVLLSGGYVLTGPAKDPLKQYRVQVLNGGNSLRVYN